MPDPQPSRDWERGRGIRDRRRRRRDRHALRADRDAQLASGAEHCPETNSAWLANVRRERARKPHSCRSAGRGTQFRARFPSPGGQD